MWMHPKTGKRDSRPQFNQNNNSVFKCVVCSEPSSVWFSQMKETYILYALLAFSTLLQLLQRNKGSASFPGGFLSFRNLYLVVYSLAMGKQLWSPFILHDRNCLQLAGADWLQGFAILWACRWKGLFFINFSSTTVLTSTTFTPPMDTQAVKLRHCLSPVSLLLWYLGLLSDQWLTLCASFDLLSLLLFVTFSELNAAAARRVLLSSVFCTPLAAQRSSFLISRFSCSVASSVA